MHPKEGINELHAGRLSELHDAMKGDTPRPPKEVERCLIRLALLTVEAADFVEQESTDRVAPQLLRDIASMIRNVATRIR